MGTFGETINNESLLERQSINKWGTFGEKIDKGALSERQSIDKEGIFGENQQYFYGFLMVLLLLVNYCRPSHIQYALYLFLLCLRDGGIFQDRIVLFDTVKMFQLISIGMFLYCSYCSGSCYPSNLTVYNTCCTYFVHAS